MCFAGIGAIGGAIASVAQAAVGYAAASEDYENKKAAWNQNYVNALAAGREDMKRYTMRQLQEQDAGVQKQHQVNIETAQKAAEVEVQAASAGLSGLSVDSLVGDVLAQGYRNRDAVRQNTKMTVEQLQAEKDAVPSQELNRINSMENPTPPNGAAFMVQAFSGIVGAFG